jgi:hypothetical protein
VTRACRRRDGLGDANVANAAAWLVALMLSSRRLGYCMDGNGKTKGNKSIDIAMSRLHDRYVVFSRIYIGI